MLEYIGRVMDMRLYCYLVLLQVYKKTRWQDSQASMTLSISIFLINLRYGVSEHFAPDYRALYIDTVYDVIGHEDPIRPFLPSSATNGENTKENDWLAEDPASPYYGDSKSWTSNNTPHFSTGCNYTHRTFNGGYAHRSLVSGYG